MGTAAPWRVAPTTDRDPMDRDTRTILAWTFAGLTSLLAFTILTGTLAAPMGWGLIAQMAWSYSLVAAAVLVLLLIIHSRNGPKEAGP